MTYREKLAFNHPNKLDSSCIGGCQGCPYDYGYASTCLARLENRSFNDEVCTRCWDREESLNDAE